MIKACTNIKMLIIASLVWAKCDFQSSLHFFNCLKKIFNDNNVYWIYIANIFMAYICQALF